MRFAIGLLLTVPALIVACGGDDTSDGGLDATVDGPGIESGVDAAIDTGADSSVDSGGDASVDSAIDSATDSSDASAVSDASDAQADAADASSDGGLDDAGCGTKMGYGFSSVTSCATGVDYSCGTDKYQIECDCPGAFCGCKKNDAGIGIMTNYAGCPKCSASPNFASLAVGCGIPY